MREGVSLAVSHAFRVLRIHRVEANVQPENQASIALVRSLGFRKEGLSQRYLKVAGRWRDHERWATLAEDWRPGRAVGSLAKRGQDADSRSEGRRHR